MTSPCDRFETTLSAWLDGDFDSEDRIELLDHFARCPACREFYLEARALDGLVAGLAAEGRGAAPPPELWERIRESARPAARPARRWTAVPAWALRAAALLVLAAGLAFVVGRGFRGGEESPPRFEVLAEESAAEMSEQRFLELAGEVLRSDRRYQVAMYQVMEQVLDSRAGLESSPNESVPRREGDETPEEAGEEQRPGRA